MTAAARSLAFAAVLALGPGCHFGTNVAAFRPAHEPMGLRAVIVTRTRVGDAELLAMEKGAYVFRMLPGGGEPTGRIVRVPFESVRTVRFPEVGIQVAEGRPPSRRDWERLRLLSRYPQGMMPPVLSRLLLAADQAALEDERP
jgi:hypothetical protein